jgi:hypothetical protein
MISTVIEAAKALVGAAGTLQMLGNERRAKLASYFDNISKVLQGFVDMTRQGEQSTGPCAELAEYAKAIRDVASPTLRADEVERLADELTNACENWQKLTPAGAPGTYSYDTYLNEIEKAAGHFRGLANVLRAK